MSLKPQSTIERFAAAGVRFTPEGAARFCGLTLAEAQAACADLWRNGKLSMRGGMLGNEAAIAEVAKTYDRVGVTCLDGPVSRDWRAQVEWAVRKTERL